MEVHTYRGTYRGTPCCAGGKASATNSDFVAHLLLAGIVYLNEFPEATKTALEEEKRELNRLAGLVLDGGIPNTPERQGSEATQQQTTPAMMSAIGWKVQHVHGHVHALQLRVNARACAYTDTCCDLWC